MCIVTLQHTVTKCKKNEEGSVKIKAPLQSLRNSEQQFRVDAVNVEKTGKEQGDSAKSTLNKVTPDVLKGFTAAVVDTVSGGGSAAIAAALIAAADLMKSQIEEVDKQFEKVA